MLIENKQSNGLHARGKVLGPAVTALSAGAADMSGWLLMGLPGGSMLPAWRMHGLPSV